MFSEKPVVEPYHILQEKNYIIVSIDAVKAIDEKSTSMHTYKPITKNNFLNLNRYLLIPIANILSGKILELTLKSRTDTNAQLTTASEHLLLILLIFTET